MEAATGEICCRLCFCSNGNFLNIFNDVPSVFGIVDLLKKYFQDEVNLSDPLPNIICSDCWRKTETFHEFHEKVLNEREKYLNSHLDEMAIKREPESILVADVPEDHFDEFDVNMFVDPIIVKPIHIDELNVDDGHRPFSNILIGRNKQIPLTEIDHTIFDEFSVMKEKYEYDSYSCSGENQQVGDTDELTHFFDMRCDKCENVFESLDEALTHYNQMHNDENGYIKCCDLQFNDKFLVQDHLKWHLNPDIFKCDQCNEQLRTRTDLESHIRAFHVRGCYICGYCDKSFKAKQKLETHMMGVHVRVKMNYRCGLCKNKFQHFKHMHTHLELTHPDDLNNIEKDTKNIPYLDLTDQRMKAAQIQFVDQTCDICHVKLDTFARAKSHYRIEHKIPKGYFKCCKLKLFRETFLIRHLNWHVNPNIFRCRLCCKSFVSERSIVDHVKKHEALQSKRFTCDTCSEIFAKIEHYKMHMETRHGITIPKKMYPENESTSNLSVLQTDPEPFRCDQCERKFRHKRALVIHHAEAHLNNLIKCRICYNRFDTNATLAIHMLLHEEKHKFACPDPDCKKTFFKEGNLQAHLKRGHQTVEAVRICEFCAKTFKTKSQLKIHCRNVHNQEREQPKQRFKCDICLNFYSSKGSLRTHILNHNSGPFKCKIENCDKIAPTAGALELHMRAVHVEAKFKCHLCERCFKLAPALKDHIATHLNQKQYKCTYCEEEFIWRTNMYKHRKRIHKKEWGADKARKEAEKKMP